MSLQSTESRDSGSDLMSPDTTHIGNFSSSVVLVFYFHGLKLLQ